METLDLFIHLFNQKRDTDEHSNTNSNGPAQAYLSYTLAAELIIVLIYRLKYTTIAKYCEAVHRLRLYYRY